MKLIKPCPKFAYPALHEFDLDDERAGKWIGLGYMVAMGATPMQMPERPKMEPTIIREDQQRNKRKRR